MAKSKNQPSAEQINRVIRLYRSSQFGDAIKSAQRFIQSWPDSGFGWNILAASYEATGNLPEAAKAYSKAIQVEPKNQNSLNNYGNVLRELGNLENAVEILQRAVKLDPNFPLAQYNLGLTLGMLDQIRPAENAFRQAIKADPKFADAHNHLGNLYKAQSQYDAAVEAYSQAIKHMPNHAELHNNLGTAYFSQGNMDKAKESFAKAKEIRPDSLDILGNMGVLYLRENEPEKAEKLFRQALSVDREHTKSRSNLALSLHHQGKLTEAKTELDRCLQEDSKSTSILHNLGNLALDTNSLSDARSYHLQVVDIAPDSVAAHRNLGVTLAVLGDASAAEESYLRAIEIAPSEAETFYRLSEVRKFKAQDTVLDQIGQQLQTSGLSSQDSAFLHYAAGKAYADIGNELEKSFDHYSQGASARRASISYDVAVDENLFQSIANEFDHNKIEQIAQYGYAVSEPVFVVGMPRSGTTLVEHILSSHPEVYGAGERFDVQRLEKRANDLKGNPYPGWVPNFSAQEFNDLGESYWDGLNQFAPKAKKIIDKMPNNFRYPGLIYGMLSGAKVIHVKRNPLDTCYSCFTHLFDGGQDFSYDLTELGKFYKAYWGLMQHWKSVLPEDFYREVQYEDIVNNPENTIRGLLEHCDLSWDSSCLNFFETKRVVPTASLVQVRQPLYKSAIGRWKPYESQLQPLIEALGELAESSSSAVLH